MTGTVVSDAVSICIPAPGIGMTRAAVVYAIPVCISTIGALYMIKVSEPQYVVVECPWSSRHVR